MKTFKANHVSLSIGGREVTGPKQLHANNAGILRADSPIDPGFGPFKYGKSVQPEPDRLIVFAGADTFGDFTCVGKYVLYKGGKPGRRKGRFMRRRRDGEFEPDQNSWHDRETWEYLDEKEKTE